MLSLLRRLWRQLPEPARNVVTRTGLPYTASFIARYGQSHHIDNFAGHLNDVKRVYGESGVQTKDALAQRFDSIIDNLVMPNGVTKTTYASRLTPILSAVFSEVAIDKSEITVLDLPSSTGITSLEALALLNRTCRVSKYVLGDLYHRVLFDPKRRCIYDERHNLLQVADGRRYFGVYRRHASGNEYSFLSRVILSPHTVVGWFFQRRYRYDPSRDYEPVLVAHPDVEAQLAQGVFCLEQMDVFSPIPGSYDLILSFNLLQRNYFPPEVVQAGIDNLAAALNEGGILIVGNTENYVAFQKAGGSLVTCLKVGDF